MQVLTYLVAIVIANLTINHFGPVATPYVGFLLIGFDITMRDSLHEKWHGKNLWLKMFLLITVGSLISAMFNAGRIAIASLIAFLAAGMLDAVVYQLLYEKSKIAKINGSNVVSSAVDSFLFPVIAFGSIMPGIIAGQFVAKVVGGYLWSLVLQRKAQEGENMNKLQDSDWCKGVKFGFRADYWLDRLGDILIGVAIGGGFVLWLVYA